MSQSPRAADIILKPTVPEEALFELFDEHDIYLFPSLYEPFSLTLIHALACGIPTIASDTGGNPEIVHDGDSGLLFRKGDPADLVRAVKLLAQDPGLRVRLSQNGQLAARAFTFERMVGEMIEFLRHPA
jgi:glycogen(starch) synthase